MERRLSIRMAGPEVPEGKFALRDLQRIVHPLEQAVRALLPASKPDGVQKGRPRKPQVRFLLSAIESGSAVASGEIDMDLEPTLENFGVEPLVQLVEGLDGTSARLPENSRRHLDRIAQNLPDGVDYVELVVPAEEKSARIYRRRPPDQPTGRAEKAATLSGRLMSIDFRNGFARLEVQAERRQKAAAQMVLLRFPDELANDVQRCARQQVSVHGIAMLDAGGAIESLNVQRIHVTLDDRRGLWAPKRLRWPTPDERLDNVDMQEFLRTSSEEDEA